ncbi:MAG: ORF6N domain-containing protein [Patescibacteria group bacterium]
MEKDAIQNVVEHKIYIIRGQRVMVDFDLAEIYGIPTKSLNLAVRRNIQRFPEDFMFQLTKDESQSLRFQIETSKIGRGGSRYLPYVFTEHGVAMLSAVLKSQRAVQMSIFIVRAFIKMREVLATHTDLAHKIEEIERKQKEHGDQLSSVYSVVKRLINPPEGPKKKIGFEVDGLV